MNMRQNTKNLIKKKGVALISVLVVMTLLVILSFALFLTVVSERTEVFEDTVGEQLYQSAVAVNDWVFDYLERYTTALPLSIDPGKDIQDPLVAYIVVSMRPTGYTVGTHIDADGWLINPVGITTDSAAGGIPLSGVVGQTSIMGDYTINIRLVRFRCICSPSCASLNACTAPLMTFEIETIVADGTDEQSFVRIVEYRGGPGSPGSNDTESEDIDDDGFFELPASYRGAPNNADDTSVTNWNVMAILGRTYFGGNGSNFINLSGESRVLSDINSYDDLTIGGESKVFTASPMIINAWRNLTISASNMNNPVTFLAGGGVIRAGGDFYAGNPSDTGATNSGGLDGEFTTLYCFGNASIYPNNITTSVQGGAATMANAAVKNNATLYVAGDLYIMGAVGDNVTIYCNGTVTIDIRSGESNLNQLGLNIQVISPNPIEGTRAALPGITHTPVSAPDLAWRPVMEDDPLFPGDGCRGPHLATRVEPVDCEHNQCDYFTTNVICSPLFLCNHITQCGINTQRNSDHGMIAQFIELMDRSGYYENEAVPMAWARASLPGLAIPAEAGSFCTNGCIEHFYALYCSDKTCTDPVCFNSQHCKTRVISVLGITSDGKVVREIIRTCPRPKCDPAGACNPVCLTPSTHCSAAANMFCHQSENPATVNSFQPFWAPKWRPLTNENTTAIPIRIMQESPPGSDNWILSPINAEKQHAKMFDPAKRIELRSVDGLNQFTANNNTFELTNDPIHALPNTPANAIEVYDSGYIDAPTTTSGPGSGLNTMVVNTMGCTHARNNPCDGGAGCNLNNPQVHKNIYIRLVGSGGAPFQWLPSQDYNMGNTHFNVLVKGAGSVVFVMDNSATSASCGGAVENPIAGNVAGNCGKIDCLDCTDGTARYGAEGGLFVGHLGLVKLMHDYTGTGFASFNSLQVGHNNGGKLASMMHNSTLRYIYQFNGLNSDIPKNHFLDSVPVHPRIDNCIGTCGSVRPTVCPNYGSGTCGIASHIITSCHYCDPAHRIPLDAGGTHGYGYEFGRNVFRQDNIENFVQQHGVTGTKYYVHNNIFFVNDVDTTPSQISTFNGPGNVIFGFVYAPGVRWEEGSSGGPVNDASNHRTMVYGAFIYGDLGSPVTDQNRDMFLIHHLMPMDYYRHPTGRMMRNVVSSMIGKSYRGMQNNPRIIQYSGDRPGVPGTFRTVGYR